MKKPIIYAFIDSQNLNLGTSKNIDKVTGTQDFSLSRERKPGAKIIKWEA